MQPRYETIQLRTPEPGDLVAKTPHEFASVRVGGAIDGFQVVDNLAEGGMGAVFRAVGPDGAEVALKTPLPGGRGGSYHHRLRRFLRESRLTARMDHEGVARSREQGQCEGLPYFSVDLVDGTPLSERLFEEGVLPILEAVTIVEKCARAAHHVHQRGVVHRDLKPANILLRSDGQPVIIDFGLARDALGIDPRITESGIWLGTPAYIAPEQAMGEASRVDGRADVYSLGAVLFELLTGFPPHGIGSPRAIFRALREGAVQPPSELRPAVPPSVDRVVLKALAGERETRFADAEQLAEALAAVRVALEAKPPVDDRSQVRARVESWSDESSSARGWNGGGDPAEASSGTEGHAATEVELAPRAEPLEQPRAASASHPRRPRSPSGRKRRLRSTHKVAAVPARARAVRQQRDEQMAVIGRYVAFGGPALFALMGLLLLL